MGAADKRSVEKEKAGGKFPGFTAVSMLLSMMMSRKFKFKSATWAMQKIYYK